MSLDIKSGLLVELYDHWRDLNNGDIPFDYQLDPSAFPKKLFPYISLFNVEYEPRRYYAKLVGNGLIHHARIDYQHKYLDELPVADLLHDIFAWYDENIDQKMPSVRILDFISKDDLHIPSERLFLPYQNMNGVITKFIVSSIIQTDRQTHHTLP